MKENTPSTELSYNDLPELVDIVGISFRTAGKIYYFASNGVICREGEHAIVETTRGAEYGFVSLANHLVPKKDLVLPLRSVIRVSTPEDDKRFELNAKREEEAYTIAVNKIVEHKLDMKLVDVEYTFDNSKLLFYFTADDRVDFRDLVKDLASVFRTRIELRQIGIRDEAKMMGGLGICGREFCCHSFLGDFAQVTIKMAKEQNLSLNAAKISGACGKLMCCLRYEHEAYQQEIALTPKVDSKVTTPDGPGIVVSTDPLRGLCTVRLEKNTDNTTSVYHRDLLNRPENPTTVPHVVAEKTEKADKSAKPEVAPKLERNEKTERPNRHNRPDADSVSTLAPVVEKPEPEDSIAPDTPVHSERSESNERRGNRHSNNKGRGAHKKKNENKGEPKPVAESQANDKSSEGKRSAPPPKNEKNEHKERAPQKPNRSHSTEKKSDSKFDVKFAGGEVAETPKNEESRQNSRPGGRGHGYHHRRSGKGEKKNEKKPQKTENND